MRHHFGGAMISAGIALAAGLLSAFISGNQAAVYQTLNLPPLSPPGWIFAVIWPILYIAMGIAAYWVYSSRGQPVLRKRALALYTIQLLLNILWSPIFFGLMAFGGAAILLGALIIAVVLTMLSFVRIKPCAAWLLLPYLCWLLFAGYLNIGVFLLNP